MIRFAVGDKNDVRSSVWRLWSNGNDLYLAARSFSHISKFSFHESGRYRFAINKEVEREDDASDRVLFRWERPPEFTPGWTRCFGLLVPPRVTCAPFVNTFYEKKAIKFVAFSEAGRKVIFNILLSHKTASREEVVRGSPHNAIILGCIEMTRELAWLVSFQDVFTPIESVMVASHFNKLKIHLSPGSSSDSMKRCFLHTLKEGVTPFLFDIELGNENLDIPVV